jgi:hypothetical protein
MALPARAGIVFADQASAVGAAQVVNNSHVVTGSTFDTATTNGSANSLASVDGTLGLNLDPSTGTNVFQFRWLWYSDGSANDISNANGDISLRLFLANVGSGITVVIQDVVFQLTGGGTIPSASFLGINQTVTAGANGVEQISLTPGAATFANGFATDFSQFNATFITLSFTGGTGGVSANDTFQIDAISTTPEPGSIALFGLGILGLGGLVRRRRRQRAARLQNAG